MVQRLRESWGKSKRKVEIVCLFCFLLPSTLCQLFQPWVSYPPPPASLIHCRSAVLYPRPHDLLSLLWGKEGVKAVILKTRERKRKQEEFCIDPKVISLV